MTSYEDAERKFREGFLELPVDYDSFIMGYCRSMALGAYGQAVTLSLQDARDRKGKAFTGLDLYTILYGVVTKMSALKDPPEQIYLSANIGYYILGYLITDRPVRGVALILYNFMANDKLRIQTSPIEEIERELIHINSYRVEDLVNLLIAKFKDLPKVTGTGTGLSDRQALIALGATYKVWSVVKEMGQSGIQKLVQIMNSSDSTQGVVASIILTAWDSPQHNLIEGIYDVRSIVSFSSPGPKDVPTKVIGNLGYRTLALSGNSSAKEWIINLCQQKGTTLAKWMNDSVRDSIGYVRDFG